MGILDEVEKKVIIDEGDNEKRSQAGQLTGLQSEIKKVEEYMLRLEVLRARQAKVVSELTKKHAKCLELRYAAEDSHDSILGESTELERLNNTQQIDCARVEVSKKQAEERQLSHKLRVEKAHLDIIHGYQKRLIKYLQAKEARLISAKFMGTLFAKKPETVEDKVGEVEKINALTSLES